MRMNRMAASLVVTAALLLGQVAVAAAAPLADPLVGTIDGISEGTDAGGNTVIIVDYTDSDGLAQTATLSVDEAVALGLISVDPVTGDVTILGIVGDPIDLTGLEEVDPCVPSETSGEPVVGGEPVDTTETTEETGGGHPVAGALCEFFQGSLGVDYALIMGWHEDGFGFGVIAQALFMAENLGVDPALILEAKKGGDFSALGLPEDADVSNWGQLRKYVMTGEVKSLKNLGAIISGRAEPTVTETPTGEPTTLAPLTSTSLTSPFTTKLHGNGGNHGKKGEHGKGHNK